MSSASRKCDAWGLVGQSLGEGRELLRRGLIGTEADQRAERVNTGQWQGQRDEGLPVMV